MLLQGYEQQVIDVMLDAYRQEQLVNVSDALDMPLISPFQPDQPLQRELRYHTPPRFSKEVVEGIRHAAGKLFKVGSLRAHPKMMKTGLMVHHAFTNWAARPPPAEAPSCVVQSA